MSSYIDKNAIMNVIGCIFKDSSILEHNEYYFSEEDFVEKITKIIYGALNNLYIDGIRKFDLIILDEYLSKIPSIYNIFQTKGIEYIKHCINISSLDNFNYYFERMKKFTLMRTMENYGINMKWFYNPTVSILNIKEIEEQENRLNNTSLSEILNLIDKHIENIKLKCTIDDDKIGILASEGLKELIENLKEKPEIGIPMYGKYINTITKGARLSKLYLRSAATGVGKSRTLIADACMFACNELYDTEQNKWIKNGTKEPTLYITTEQEIDEIQTMLIAFVADVDEEKIINGDADFNEMARIARAIQILEESPLYIVSCPNFSLSDIENIIKINIKKFNIKYITYDYLHTSIKILDEITKRSGGVKLREDNILFMLAVALKDLCNKYQIFIITSTQLNGKVKIAIIYLFLLTNRGNF